MDLTEVVCGVCFDIFVKPMVLRCGHSFCELCAEESINFNDKCPLCRKKSVGICIYNRSLDSCIQTLIQNQEASVRETYDRRIAENKRMLLLKKNARIILWTVISHSKNSSVRLEDVENLYNEIQQSLNKEEVEFDDDLREQIRREALLHEGYLFMLHKDDPCNKIKMIDTINKKNEPLDSNAIALRSPGKALSRNQSVSSIDEDFLPTFESEDYDWRRFGWLLDEDSNELPSVNVDKKRERIEKQLPLELKIPSESDDVPEEALLSNQSLQWSICSEAASSRGCCSRTLDELSEEGDLNMKKIMQINSETTSEDESCSEKIPVLKKTPNSLSEEMSQQENEENLENDLKTKMSLDEVSSPVQPQKKPYKKHTSESDDEPIAKRTRRSSSHKSDLECTNLLKPRLTSEIVLASALRKCCKRRKASTRKRNLKETKYCVCKKPYDPARMYVGCDKCFDWFHPRCIGITEREAEEADHFYCPKCVRNDEQRGQP